MSSTTSKVTKAAVLAQLQALIAGLQKHFPGGQFMLGNATYTTLMLVPLVQSLIDAINKVNAAQASARDAVTAMRAVKANVGPTISALNRNLRLAYGTASQVLLDYGLEPEKARTPLTTEQQAAKVAKAKATREARGTGSKKQKSAVTGNVVGVTVTPNTVVPAPAEPPAQQTVVTGAPSPGTTK